MNVFSGATHTDSSVLQLLFFLFLLKLSVTAESLAESISFLLKVQHVTKLNRALTVKVSLAVSRVEDSALELPGKVINLTFP